ncbi:hypothetical protein AbraIFM66951_011791 [Aspergillus brasiliensis]|uniref:Uncharacterized protein n=1 Tax=Aspergillus brasiliensis TaxID=319629 RepID=A0A9W6DPL3_9EURO|nr:hypothetical protein AbraCBS73388_011953 [Aspergillus brasiliensis]GKZ48041.1 hypothetical protein AbraIFM66951_011791 [Aspergillus brasiliensis]
MSGEQSNASVEGKKKAPDSFPSTSRPKGIRKSLAKTKGSSQDGNNNTDSATPLAKRDQDTNAAKRIQSLEEEIESLKERNKALQTIFFEDVKGNMYADSYLEADGEIKHREVQWSSCCPAQWSTAISAVFLSPYTWVYNHIHRDPSRLSTQQKKEIVSRLDGYCVQEDFDDITSSLPESARKSFLGKMVQLLLAKECISRFFTNPFWYLVPDPGTEENPKMDTTGFGAQVFTLYENIRAYQDLLRSLLKSSDETAFHDALVHLQECFYDAAQTSVVISSNLGYLELATLDSLGRVYSSDKMALAPYWDPDTSEKRLNGSRILFIDFPAVYTCDGRKDSSNRMLARPAVVYVEDNDVVLDDDSDPDSDESNST